MTSRPVITTHGEGGIELLVKERYFRGRSSGVFVDVGAAKPDYLSLSAIFRESGWRVIAVEPNPQFCAMHRAAGYEVLQYACADFDGNDVPFSVVDSHGEPYRDGAVTCESFSAISVKPSYRVLRPDLEIRQIPVAVRRLDTLLREHAPEISKIDVLSIDVEGWELEVLRGLSIERFQPTVVILENFLNDAAYPASMSRAGYVIWRRSAPNDVYVRTDAVSARSRVVLTAYTWLLSVSWRFRSAFMRAMYSVRGTA